MDTKILKVKEKLTDKLELPKDIVMNLPKITVIGNSEITVENHKGIINFDNVLLRVNTQLGSLKICGENLEILFIGGETITVGGKFKTIEYEELI